MRFLIFLFKRPPKKTLKKKRKKKPFINQCTLQGLGCCVGNIKLAQKKRKKTQQEQQCFHPSSID
jgi:hypothetical protein